MGQNNVVDALRRDAIFFQLCRQLIFSRHRRWIQCLVELTAPTGCKNIAGIPCIKQNSPLGSMFQEEHPGRKNSFFFRVPLVDVRHLIHTISALVVTYLCDAVWCGRGVVNW